MISQSDLRWKRCDIKSTNLLANVLASEAARRAGCHEAVLIDPEGFVTEATHSSLLWVREGRLEGTPEGHEILPGMTRGLVLRLLKPLGIPFAGTRVTLPALVAADEVILVGTTYEVLPVIEIDGQTIGSGAARPARAASGRALSPGDQTLVGRGAVVRVRRFVPPQRRTPGWSWNDDERGHRRPLLGPFQARPPSRRGHPDRPPHRIAIRASGSRHRPAVPSGSPSSGGRSSNGSSRWMTSAWRKR